MDSNFDASLKATLIFEGGKVDDPKDPGGRTAYGITQRTYDASRKGLFALPRDVYLITPDEVASIYQRDYWAKVGAGTLPAGVDFAAFDYGVNSGPARAKKAIPLDGSAVERVKRICAIRTSFVNAIRNFDRFRKGVLTRVAKVEVIGVKMALAGVSPSAAFNSQTTKVTIAKEATSAAGKATDAKAASHLTAGATATGTTVGAGASSHAAAAGFPWWLFLAMVAIGAAVAGFFYYQRARHSARAVAYAEAV